MGQDQNGSDDSPKAAPRDVVVVAGRHEPTGGLEVLRFREDRVEAGVLEELKEGKPIHGEAVRLTPRDGAPGAFDVSVLVPRAEPPSVKADGGRKGPKLVNSHAFRTGWDSVFGNKDVN